jgi:hypothetical protein
LYRNSIFIIIFVYTISNHNIWQFNSDLSCNETKYDDLFTGLQVTALKLTIS